MNDDLSTIFEKLNIDKNSISPDMINNLMNILNNSSIDFTNNNTQDSNYAQNNSKFTSQQNNTIDFDTIIKLKSVIDNMNIKNDPRSKLLESLKPYLKESRRNKIDQYVQIINMSNIMENFNLFNGDNKNVSK